MNASLLRLVMAALALVILSLGYIVEVDVIMAVGFACGAIAGATTLWLVISQPQHHWSCCDILAGSTIGWYYMGAGSSMWFADPAQLKYWNITKDYDLTYIYGAALYLAIFAIFMHAFGAWERRFWRPVLARLNETRPIPGYLFYLLVMVSLCQVVLLASGKWSFGGFDTSDQARELDSFTATIVAIAWPVAALSAFILGKGRTMSSPILYTYCMALLPLQLLWSLAYGRRVLIYQVLTVVAAYLWAKRSKGAMRLVIILGLIGVPVISYASQLFLAIRLAQWSSGISGAKLNMLEHLSRGNAMMGQRTEALRKMSSENLSTRTFMIGYFASLIANTSSSSPMIGIELAVNTLEAVPRFVFPLKTDILLKTGKHEQLYHPHFNLMIRDEANSYATSSWVDFWFFGPLVYPAILALLGFALAKLTGSVPEQWMIVYYLAYVLFSFMFVEETFTVYLLTLRSLLAVSIMAFIVKLMLNRRSALGISGGRV